MGMSVASRSGRRSRRAPMAEINVTPFVDVMLVLLIIFMVTAPMLAVGVPIELPDSRANPVDQTPEQVTISLDSTGAIYIDDTVVSVDAFPTALGDLGCATGDQPVVVFRGDRAVEYGQTMAVLGELNRAGCNSVSLVTSGSVTPP